MVYKYTSSLNFNVLTTFTLQPSSVFHCLKKCSPHFALNWWVCIAKVGYKHCPHHRFRNRFIRENANWRNGMECGGDQELPGLNARKACPGASPQHTHCSTLHCGYHSYKEAAAAAGVSLYQIQPPAHPIWYSGSWIAVNTKFCVEFFWGAHISHPPKKCTVSHCANDRCWPLWRVNYFLSMGFKGW